MYKMRNIAIPFLLSALTLFSNLAWAEKPSEKAFTHCKKNSKGAINLSMCLDQKLQKIEREHKTWLRSRELEASTTSKNLREPSILIEFKKSNEYYMAFINSRCRRIFFENQYKGNEADLLRLCKIDEITRRIEQLKSDSKYN